MRRVLQVKNGVAVAEVFTTGSLVPPDETWTFVDVTDRPDAQVGDSYDAPTDTFTAPAPRVNTILTRADVIGLLTAQEWAEMNKFSPTAAGANENQIPYNDAEVFYVVSLFNQAQYIDLADARTSTLLASLVTKGVVTPERAAQLSAAMQALAASR